MYSYVEKILKYIAQKIVDFFLFIYFSFFTYDISSIYNNKIQPKKVSWNPELCKIDYTHSKEDYDRSRYKPLNYYLF